ncbi:glycogen branching protein [Ectothiorhodospira haloalkaliphila]|uniref:1,4-alpha-glucan branching enzyme GlgB n=1 Tax=Ectothiorhodospira haloalkaliphila TaxID=421628 RepID=W8KJ21_9GAMM|nr:MULTISPECIES: 1,4-alpha-glucan branching protein GlgB [Ectothiorhodospira]AHK79133.1 glycogen branching protein [Ectothiorhodospira haloalkaliphila]MCG5495034.1 1,4-alpha-glucan branching protein GlgB [Ectothiorhodospira variabilis]MCG5498575.1 1,4-alpha-glucan branching protein GlgB [Ectothiorhodospira variabilis]MCG5504621.1 1,4-alpha-glucan branching protein GlgB [Ectothiorhodospira variabilis]MCG5507826.1 1,4-alpha-glucan branching protein GlgB [Ectothiorhodospira variabilis]
MRATNREDLQRILDARHHDPFSLLGSHVEQEQRVVRAYLPHATQARIDELDDPMEKVHDRGIFEWRGPLDALPGHYRIRWNDGHGHEHVGYDPYSFGPVVSDFDIHLFNEGRHWHAYRFLGAHAHEVDGIQGVRFAVWAPSAERVSVVGDFNRWDGRCHTMRVRGGSGVWEFFIPGLEPGTLYKYEIRNRDTGATQVKTDPYGQRFELRPQTAAVVHDPEPFSWSDEAWLKQRAGDAWLHRPMSIYEVHLGSWRLGEDGNFLNYRELARTLVPYVKEMGFTHIELLPVTEHPFDGSWGYQTTGYYAPTSRFGSPDDFRDFVNHCHENGIGVLLDWAPGHFPKDAHALARFDGSALYEHEDPRMGEHRDWGTLIFNYGRNEVRNFLVSSAMYWVEEFHIDGLRVDAVASMLYLNYSREEGEWVPNKFGGQENLDAIEFLRDLNSSVQGNHPGALIMAEESTSWPQVTRPTWLGGLGFSLKWNMGWMNDTLEYFKKDPIHRHYHHDQLTFGLLYAFTENFVLPFSHDEVVHGKRSLLYRMPGDEWQRFANLRLLYTLMWSYPGKKLLFMGCEYGQGNEWDDAKELEWYLLQFPFHSGVKQLVADLNALYAREKALHHFDFEWQGFEWIDCHDAAQSVLSFIRKGEDKDDFILATLNFTPAPREGYRIGVPAPGRYREIFNSDSHFYCGSNLGNLEVEAEDLPWMGRPYSVVLTLPPLAGILLKPVST